MLKSAVDSHSHFLLSVGSRQLVFFKTCLHEVDKEDKGGIEEDKGG